MRGLSGKGWAWAFFLVWILVMKGSVSAQDSGGRLSFEEAKSRSSLIRNVRYEVFLDLTDPGEEFISRTRVTFEFLSANEETFIDFAAKNVNEAVLNGSSLPPGSFDRSRLKIAPAQGQNELWVEGIVPYEHTGVGLHKFVDPTDGNVYLHTQFEPYDAHRVYSCFDQPDIKAGFTLKVRAPNDWKVVSNERAIGPPEEDPEGKGWKEWIFAPTPKISTYITALIAGPYEEVRSEHKGLPMALYVRQSLRPYLDSQEIFSITQAGLDFFQRKFGIAYPFSKYDQAFVPEFSAGAMENAGLVTFNERSIFRSRVSEAQREGRANTILHEMSHMWFGNLVTMRWWDDLWLNESFADFMASYALQEVTRFKNAWVHFANLEKAQALRADQLSTTHPIVAHYPDTDAVRLGFDAITYQKGASVLKQLVAYLGDDAFFEGLRRYLSANAFDNAELADFLSALEQVSPGKDLKEWAEAWLQTAGVNTIVPRLILRSDRIESAFLVQTSQSGPANLRPHFLGVGLYRKDGDKIVRSRSVSKVVRSKETPLPELRSERMPDIFLPNDGDLTYAKIRLDAQSDRTAKERLSSVEDPLARSLLWGCFWDRTRDAEYASRAWMDLFYAHVSGETDPMVLSVLLSNSENALMRFTHPDRMQGATGRFARFAKERMESSPPGSDEQLCWAQAFFREALEEDQLDFLKGLLDGEIAVPGLALDFDRRWQAIQTLAQRGRIRLKEIQEELKRDPTDMGQRNALQARAALPTPEAKAWAWREATQNLEIPLRSREAIAQGFWSPFQEDVLNPYALRYFEDVSDFWRKFGPDEAIVLTRRLFPRLVIEERIALATERLLKASDLPKEARRILMEEKDELNRAIKARCFDGASS